MRVLVFGSRSFSDRDLIHSHLDAIAAGLPDGERLYVINGFASGADRTADEWASAHDRAQPVRYRADWRNCDTGHHALPCPADDGAHRRRYHGAVRPAGDDYCPLAGLRRNQRMLDVARPDMAFGYVDKPLDESRGSLDMYNRLVAAGIEAHVHQSEARS